MRLAQQQILEGLLHPEQGVRGLAFDYLRSAGTCGETAMQYVIRGIERYGWEETGFARHHLPDLPQSDESLDWASDALRAIPADAEEPFASRRMHLSRLIAAADINLLLRRRDLLATRNLMPEFRRMAEQRLALVNMDVEVAWRQLQAFCEENDDTPYVDGIDLPHARCLVEMIAREAGHFADRVLDALDLPDDPSDDLSNPWLEGLMVELAGRMRLEEAVPLVTQKLHLDADWLSEQCVEALSRIGTDAAVKAVAADFPYADWPFRLYASEVFERSHSDLAVETATHLLEDEEDETVRVCLLEAILRQFDDRAIALARQELLTRELTPDLTEVRSHLLDAAELMGVGFPEKEAWRESSKQDMEFRRQWYAKQQGQPNNVGFHPELSPIFEPEDEPLMPIRERPKIGRNASCPRGSGRKFKKCCGAG